MRCIAPENRFGRPSGGRRRLQAAWLGALVLLAGCAARDDGLSRFLRSNEHVVSAGDYRVNPPDAITIHVPIAPEIDGVTAQVRPDGKIALRLLGEVQVAGLTTEEIAEKLRGLVGQYYVDPDVVVDVAVYQSHYYYIFGEVYAPGPKLYTGRDTLINALAKAQPNQFAWREQIRVTRPGAEPGERAVITVNLNEIVQQGDMTRDVLLQPGDIIEVPPTPLAWVGHQVRALLYPVTPVLDAYQTPADFIEARNNYRDLHDDDDDNGGRRLRLPQ